MFVISSSYGNDSCALIQYAYEIGLDLVDDVSVVFIDTGWASKDWPARVAHLSKWVMSLGFNAVNIKPPVQFEELMLRKRGFPNQQYQWCSAHLKGMPFLDWVDRENPDGDWVVLIGKRREESPDRADTPEYVYESEYHGGRTVWHPLYLHTEAQRDALLSRAGIKPLPHRSMECNPCVNANRADLLLLTDDDIAKVQALEAKTGCTMFRPMRYKTRAYPNGCHGIQQVIQWARKEPLAPDEPQGFSECSSGYCGY